MEILRPGDVLLYEVTTREKGTVKHYYGCEVVGSIAGDRPFNLSGELITGVRAIYRRENANPADKPERVLVPRRDNDPYDMSRLARELEKIYGPGDLVTGISCKCEAACSILKTRL